MTLNYFTCTLGQAALTQRSGWQNVNDLIHHQSVEHSSSPAVGFAYPTDSSSVLYSFQDVYRGTQFVAGRIRAAMAGSAPAPRSTVALLSSSTPEFLFTWLALIRLGYGVLLIAPQNQPEAIVHLCKACSVELFVYDQLYEALAENALNNAHSGGLKGLHLFKIPFKIEDDEFVASLHCEPRFVEDAAECKSDDIAYLFHTSGTSSGLPKPIPQTHHGAVEVLPSFEGQEKATYSTTPLYHGGISDCFRAWSSNALIWLFPGKTAGETNKSIPITASNILSCSQTIEGKHSDTPAIKYFTSVPYILQMMATDTEGLKRLQAMDCVGVGGAALPEEVGNRLVEQDVNLVSRYGSAECGFLLSSHRDYAKDKAWQYLRADTGMEHLAFEPQDENKHEVVVKPGWPHMSKTNREDGSYATADLMTPHPSIPNAWRYDSRADSQLTLITGKKFDPAPLEGAIASWPLLEDVLIFGNGQPFPGALLFRSKEARDYSDSDLVSALAPHIEELNVKSQSHARVPRNMLVPIAYGGNKLQKSSKGTILRNKAEEMYGGVIASTYERLSSPVNDKVPDSGVFEAIREAVAAIVSAKTLGADDDLFAHGVDSLGSIQIRHSLRRLLPSDHEELSVTVVEDCGTIAKLSNYVLRCRHGDAGKAIEDDEIRLMQGLVSKYSDFQTHAPSSSIPPISSAPATGETVLLTGATGALGAHLLSQYRSSASTKHIYCLVRGVDAHAAKERVQKSLTSRKLAELDGSDKVKVLPCKLSEPQLGLTTEQYEHLQRHVTTVLHAAWSVNFRWRLSSFEKDHIAGTRHLLNLAFSSPKHPPPTFTFCSSIASVSAIPAQPNTPNHNNSPPQTSKSIPEIPSTNPQTASPLGYSRSKWVTEALLTAAKTSRPDLLIQILRIGQLSGDTHHGIWNNSEAWPLMLGSISATGFLPDLGTQPLDWLAVDVAARAVVEIAGSSAGKDGDGGEVAVRHLLNADRSATWGEAMGWLKGFGERFKVVEPGEWVRRLERLEGERREVPALRLLGMWKERYGREHEGEVEEQHGDVRFDVSKAKAAAPVLRSVQPVSEEYFRKLWMWVKENATT